MYLTMIVTGYVGLVSGACFADFGHQVACIDKDAAKIEQLRAGRSPIFEPCGSCFPKDASALAAIGQRHGAPVRIVETVIGVNNARKSAMVQKVIGACDGSVRGKRLAVLGLAFKPNTDDMREAPSLSILPVLAAEGAAVIAYDPAAMEEAHKLLPEVATAADPYACIDGADAMIILTEWDQFRALDLDRIKTALRKPVVIDLRNVYKPDEMAARGFTYVSIGRPDRKPS